MIVCINLSKPRKMIINKINDIKLNHIIKTVDKKSNIETAIEVTATSFMITITNAFSVSADSSTVEKVTNAINPLIDMVQALGYPLTMLSITAGAIVMIFSKKIGLRIIKDTIIAFLVLQFVPSLLMILMEIGKALRQ